MNDEICGVSIKGFIGLKSKMYTFATQKAIINVKSIRHYKNAVDEKLK